MASCGDSGDHGIGEVGAPGPDAEAGASAEDPAGTPGSIVSASRGRPDRGPVRKHSQAGAGEGNHALRQSMTNNNFAYPVLRRCGGGGGFAQKGLCFIFA